MDEDSEGELPESTYARETIVERWTAMTMLLQWVALATASQRAMEKNSNLQLPIDTLQSFLDAGADPTFPIGANVGWNSFEFIASCSYQLSQTTISCCHVGTLEANDVIDVTSSGGASDEANHHQDREGCTSSCEERLTAYKYVQNILSKKSGSLLRPDQSFVAAIISNDVESANKIRESSPD